MPASTHHARSPTPNRVWERRAAFRHCTCTAIHTQASSRRSKPAAATDWARGSRASRRRCTSASLATWRETPSAATAVGTAPTNAPRRASCSRTWGELETQPIRRATWIAPRKWEPRIDVDGSAQRQRGSWAERSTRYATCCAAIRRTPNLERFVEPKPPKIRGGAHHETSHISRQWFAYAGLIAENHRSCRSGRQVSDPPAWLARSPGDAEICIQALFATPS